MREAARLYCEGIGAHLDRHQVVVYQHFDQKHPHVHLYLNRVPIGGGIALSSSHNYARNVKVCRAIEHQLNFSPLPNLRTSLSDHLPQKMEVRLKVRETLNYLLQEKKVYTVSDLRAELSGVGIESRFQYDRDNKLVGSSFRVNEVAVKGTEVGFKAKHLDEMLRKNSHSTRVDKKSREEPVTVALDLVQGGLVVKSAVKDTNVDLSKIEKSLYQARMQLWQMKHKAKAMSRKKLVKKGINLKKM